MRIWVAVLAASAAAYATKLAGFVVPRRWLAHPRVVAVSAALPAALLAALLVVQGFTAGHHLALDARAPALLAAAVALRCRAPFLVTVLVAAAAAALVRAVGWG